jgi:glucose/mannose-6-phosphate isomerase
MITKEQIEAYDKSNALAVAALQPAQLGYDFNLKVDVTGVENIVLAGMGGSALAAEFLRSWLGNRLKVPFVIVRDYELPAFVGPKTLLFISSYSGNTEETLACLDSRQAQTAKTVIMAAGGRLVELAMAKNRPLITIPAGLQPRMAVLYGVNAIAAVIEPLGLQNASSELLEAAEWVSNEVKAWSASQADNYAMELAQQLYGKVPVIYAGATLSMVALKWKINFNENAKNLAFWYGWPEFSHNEFQGWLNPTQLSQKDFKVIELQSDLDHPHVGRRFKISDELLAGHMPKPIIIKAKGETKLQQMLWMLLLGDFTSIYLGILNQVDPTGVDLIEKLKQDLAKDK